LLIDGDGDGVLSFVSICMVTLITVWQTAFPVEDVPDAIAYDQVSWLSPEHGELKPCCHF
jgi:hypothetical protein